MSVRGTAGARPLVSVVVPSWNSELTLLETLRSVAAQTYRELEIIIVNDGSTDRTPALAAQFCGDEPRARLITQTNGGVASARNAGIAEARGDWVAPVDADDLWHPAKIGKQVAAVLAARERPGFAYCWFRVIDGDGNIVGSGPRWEIQGHGFNRIAYRNPVGNGSALLISRDAALRAGGYDPSLRARGAQGCEDVLLQLLIARDHPVALVPGHLVGYRRHPQSMSQDQARIVRSWQAVYARMKAEGALTAQLERWNRADVELTLAEADAVAGNRAAAAARIANAVWLDPPRSTAFLLYRAARLAGRLARGRRPAPAPLQFLHADPAAVIPSDPDELGFARKTLTAIDDARLRRLGELDRRAGAGTGHG